MIMNRTNKLYSRLCGERMTNGEVVLYHAVLLALLIGAALIEDYPIIATSIIAVGGVLGWMGKKYINQ